MASAGSINGAGSRRIGARKRRPFAHVAMTLQCAGGRLAETASNCTEDERGLMSANVLHRQSTIAPPGYNRFLVPPAALAVHLSIGQAYAFSTYNLPLTKLIGLSKSAPGDWTLAQVGWIFSIGILFLGMSAAVFGRWVGNAWPRTAMFAAALCFGGGFMVSALGVAQHQIWLLYLGYGALRGCGLGIGYISPVSTLIKWFPDRPGM